MDNIGLWITVFVVDLLVYPVMRWRGRLGNLTFWRWVLYSIFLVGTALIIHTLFRAFGLFSDG